MRSTILTLSAVLSSAIAFAGCGGPANLSNANTANANQANSNMNTTTSEVTNDAPTLTPVFKAYCAAWVKNDEAALRKVYSADTIKRFETQMKEDKVKSLLTFLEVDKVSGNPCRVTNEEITGDKALGTIFSNKYPTGIRIEFVKEDGEWKMTNRSLAISSVEQSSNSNAATTAK